jgi:predicted nuclease with TOPRIM domain
MLQEKTAEKVDQSIIDEINTLQQNFNQVQINLGKIEIDFHRLETQKQSLKEEVIKLETKETEIAQKIEDKYGQGSLDLGTGEFTKQ